MKNLKNFCYILVSVLAVVLAMFSGWIVACKLVTNENNVQVTNPGVAPNDKGKGYIVSVYNISDVEYVNVYRQEVINVNEDGSIEGGNVFNIGIVYPEYYELHSWTFQDAYVHKDHKYHYRVKYTLKDGTVYKSGWSKIVLVDAQKGYEENEKFNYTVEEDATFDFDDTNYTLTLTGGKITSSGIPRDILIAGITPKIVFSNGKRKIAYTLSKIDPGSNDIDIGSCLWLRNVLEPDFLDTKITLEAIVFERVIYTEIDVSDSTDGDDEEKKEKQVKCVVWGNPTETLPSAPNSITVKSTKIEAGFDYSD